MGTLLSGCLPRESLEGGSGAGKGRAGQRSHASDPVSLAPVPLSEFPLFMRQCCSSPMEGLKQRDARRLVLELCGGAEGSGVSVALLPAHFPRKAYFLAVAGKKCSGFQPKVNQISFVFLFLYRNLVRVACSQPMCICMAFKSDHLFCHILLGFI